MMKGLKRLQSIVMSSVFSAALLLGVAGSGAQSAAASGESGAVYVLTNGTSNSVAAFNRAADGTLTPAGMFATGGVGTGAGLGSQGALALSKDHHWLFAVNAASNDISVFAVQPNGLSLVNRAPSGGEHPISLSAHKSVLYVLNAGGAGNITGFSIGRNGVLAPIPGSTQLLSNHGAGVAPGPAQVGFDPTGAWLVVTEKATNLIDVYAVNDEGVAQAPVAYASHGLTPFGFAFDKRGHLIVSEAFGGGANPGKAAVSSYDISDAGLVTLSGSAPDYQTAACWVAVTKNGRYAYTTNAGSGSISGYSIEESGSLSLLNADGRTGITGDGSTPIDMAFSINSQFLYALNAGARSISIFAVQSDGSLVGLPGISGLLAGTVGLAAY